MLAQFREAAYDEHTLRCEQHSILMLENPSIAVRDENRIQTAASAGLISDFGLLPTIHVASDASSYFRRSYGKPRHLFGHDLGGRKISFSPNVRSFPSAPRRPFCHQYQMVLWCLQKIFAAFPALPAAFDGWSAMVCAKL